MIPYNWPTKGEVLRTIFRIFFKKNLFGEGRGRVPPLPQWYSHNPFDICNMILSKKNVRKVGNAVAPRDGGWIFSPSKNPQCINKNPHKKIPWVIRYNLCAARWR